MKVFAASLALSVAISSAAYAQSDWPSRPVTLVVPFSAGGITDIVARRLEPVLSKELGQSVVVMNVAGHPSIGTRRIIDAAPNGYEFLIHETGIMTAEASGVQDFGYRDLKPVAAVANLCLVMLSRADAGWKTVEEVKAGAEGRELIAGVAIGGLSHMAALAGAEVGGFDVRAAQVGGSADAYAALLGKQIDLMFTAPADAMNYTRGEGTEVREDADATAVLYFGPERFEGLPEVQSMADIGSEASICAPHIVFAPKETPDEIVEKMAAALKAAYNEGDLRDFMQKIGGTELFVSGAELQGFLDNQWNAIAPLAERATSAN